MKVPINSQTGTQTQLHPTEDDHTKILQALYISDQFAVGDEAYMNSECYPVTATLVPTQPSSQSTQHNSVEIDRLPSMGAHPSFVHW